MLGQPLANSPLQAVAMDGKSLRGTCAVGQQLVHLLSVLDYATGYVLSQIRVADKTNEIVAAPESLETLILEDRVVTADALDCQRPLCRQIVDSAGHYLLVVKDNQPELKDAIAAEFPTALSPLLPSGSGRLNWTRLRRTRKGHGRRSIDCWRVRLV